MYLCVVHKLQGTGAGVVLLEVIKVLSGLWYGRGSSAISDIGTLLSVLYFCLLVSLRLTENSRFFYRCIAIDVS